MESPGSTYKLIPHRQSAVLMLSCERMGRRSSDEEKAAGVQSSG